MMCVGAPDHFRSSGEYTRPWVFLKAWSTWSLKVRFSPVITSRNFVLNPYEICTPITIHCESGCFGNVVVVNVVDGHLQSCYISHTIQWLVSEMCFGARVISWPEILKNDLVVSLQMFCRSTVLLESTKKPPLFTSLVWKISAIKYPKEIWVLHGRSCGIKPAWSYH